MNILRLEGKQRKVEINCKMPEPESMRRIVNEKKLFIPYNINEEDLRESTCMHAASKVCIMSAIKAYYFY